MISMDNFSVKINKIAGVIWQLAESYPNNLKEKIQNHILYLISQVSFQNWQEAQKAIISLKNFLSLANFIGVLRLVNFEILNHEITKIELQIKEFEEKSIKKEQEVDLREVFSFEEDQNKKDNFSFLKNTFQEEENESFKEAEKISDNFKDISYRQKKILDFIDLKNRPLQSAEISKAFPRLSSRTIRNELAALCQRNILKKQVSGRKVFYTLNKELVKIR